MPTPTFVTITELAEDGSQATVNGTAVFSPNQSVYYSAEPLLIADVPITAQIINGQLKTLQGAPLQLLATDNTGLTFLSLTGYLEWSVQLTLGGVEQEPWTFFLPSTPSSRDLFSLANTAAGGSGGVSSWNSRTGAVIPQSGDYTVSQVTGAAPLASPTFTGTVTVPATVNATDAAQKAYVDSVAAGLDAKPSVKVIATGNITLSGTQTIDGVAVAAGDRVLAAGQSTSSQNGLWTVASGSWTRPADFASGSTQLGAFVFVEGGTANASSGWVLTGTGPVTVDTGAQTWTQFSGAGEITAGTGLSKSGNTISLTTPVAPANLPTATTSAQGAVIIDGTAGDIQPSPGTQAAGSVGKSADAGHVHPQPPVFAPTGLTGATGASRYVGATASGPPQSGTFAAADWALDQSAGAIWICVTAGTPGTWRRAGDKPWQFRPESYGAKGDVTSLSDAAITSGQHDLTSPSNGFATAVQGQYVYVAGAGTSGADLFTTIATVVGPGHVTTTAAAGTTVSGKGCVYHTNDAPAIKAMEAAGNTYMQANPGRRVQYLLSALYGVADAPTIGGATLGNAIFPMTIVTASTTAKNRIEWVGDGTADAAELPHWLQPAPQMTAPGLVCLRLDGTNDATYGPASVIGGPIDGYGAGTSTFTNTAIVLKNFRIYVPFNSTYCGADFLGVAEDYESGFAVQPLGIVPSGGAWPQLNQASITNQYTFGVRKSDTNNNDRQDMHDYSCEGLAYGFMASEHTTWDSNRTIYCIIGCELYAGSAMPHGIKGGHLSAEDCAFAVGVYGVAPFGNLVKAAITQIDIESSGLLFDSNNLASGRFGVMENGTPGYGLYGVTGGQGVTVTELMAQAGPIASPQAPPAFGSPWVNSYNRDVWISLSATTITGLTITSQAGTAVAQYVPSGAATYSFFLPNGSSYTPAGTGTLTHRVSRAST